jgi:hypothetical protein
VLDVYGCARRSVTRLTCGPTVVPASRMRRLVSNDLNERFQVDRVRLGGVSDHRPRPLRRYRRLKPVRGEPVQPVERPPLLGVADGIEALVHPSQRLVEDLHLFATSFVGWLGGAARTFGLHPGRTLPPQQAEVLLARSPEPAL